MSLSTKVLFGRWPRIFQYYFRIYWKKSQYKSFTTQKQQQLGENKKIRLWSTGNSYSQIFWATASNSISSDFNFSNQNFGWSKIIFQEEVTNRQFDKLFLSRSLKISSEICCNPGILINVSMMRLMHRKIWH